MASVVVTGGAGRVGAALVRAVQAQGMRAVSFDLRQNADADQSFALDVTDEAALAAAFAETGPLRGLACAAEVKFRGGIEDPSWAAWRQVMAVNAGGAMLAMKHASPAVQPGGAIVLLACGAAHKGADGDAAYRTSKGAVLGLMRASCGEFAARGVRVNAVSPGAMPDDVTPDRTANLPMAGIARRAFGADDVAGAMLFLLSDEASFITGEELVVDGDFKDGCLRRTK